MSNESLSKPQKSQQQQQQKQQQPLSCLSYHLIGLSPIFWNYNPLLIQTIHSNVLLINGINALVLVDNNKYDEPMDMDTSTTSSKTTNTNILNANHVIPISKCEIVGILQYVQYKSNNSVIMIIDDGTGLMDCIYWNNNDDNDEILNIIYGYCNNNDDNKSNKFKVGDIVRIKGQLRVLSIDHESQMILQIENNHYEHNTTGNNTNNDYYTLWEGYHCSREVYVHSIEKITDLVRESLHWLISLQFIKRIENTIHIRKENTDNIGLLGRIQEVDNDIITNEDFCSYDEGWQERLETRLLNTPVYDGLDMYNTLSNEMKTIVKNNQNFTIHNDDMDYEWNSNEKILRDYHGRQCRCKRKSLLYMDDLMYCHCIASKEPLDGELKFRDALLELLLQMESKYYSNLEEQKNNNDNISSQDTENSNTLTSQPQPQHQQINHDQENTNFFQFKYLNIYQNESLYKVAEQTVSQSTNPKTNIRRLYMNTFHHLRKDGILHLNDVDEDIYILLSMKHVLIPSMHEVIAKEEQHHYLKRTRSIIGSSSRNADEESFISLIQQTIPTFLTNLSRKKYRILKSIVEKERNQNNNEEGDEESRYILEH